CMTTPTVDSLIDLSKRQVSHFREFVNKVILQRRSFEFAYIERQAVHGGKHWKLSIEKYHKTLLSNLNRPDFFLPAEFRHCCSVEDGFAKLQSYLYECGSLMKEWSDIRNAALHRNSSPNQGSF